MVKLTDNALLILKERYLLKSGEGLQYETPEEMFWRVAKAVAEAERKWEAEKEVLKWATTFFELMSKLYFLPNSPTLMNAGTNSWQLSACFVLPVKDSLKDIFSTLRQAALIHQKGGGTGFNFSHLRPKGDPVYTSGGHAGGPVSFLRIFDAATAQVKQGGKRRGANMGILHVNHPDIEEFIYAKSQTNTLQNFNLSVGITDDFMKSVNENGVWNLIHPKSQKLVKTINSQELWQFIVHNAWACGDPGLLFLDTINSHNPTPELGQIEATNPCGEVPLMPYESCNLGSINLSKFTLNQNGDKDVDWKGLERTIGIAVRFLDDVIEVNKYPQPKIKKTTTDNRKIGLGVMGWAEMLIKLGIPYDTDKAVALAGRVMRFIQEKSKTFSMELSKTRGVFPNWEKSVFFPDKRMRNATCTSIAPTGTISIIADTSSSIEPLFALAYQRRNVLNGENLTSINGLFLDHLYELQLNVNNTLQEVFKNGTCEHISSIPLQTKKLYKTALEIDPIWHLKHLIAFQRFTENAVSKTINLNASASPQEVDHLFKMAWENNTKGITIFRNQTNGRQVLNRGIMTSNTGCKYAELF